MPKYFVAILPPSDLILEIIQIQKELENGYGTSHAQKTPPHITVIPPFDVGIEKMDVFKSSLRNYLEKESFHSIVIELDNFQKFESRTLFIDVAKNEHFEQFCKRIKLFFLQQKIVPQRIDKHFFVPHITIANKDLNKKNFRKAWEEFQGRDYNRTFQLEALFVLKHNGIVWEIEEEIV